MKKFFLAALCALGLAATAQAQDTFRKGDQVLNLGIGLGRETAVMSIPPISGFYERSVADGIIDKGSFGLGLQGEIATFRGAGLALFVGPRASFHYEFVDRLDTYFGIQAGLYFFGSAAFEADGVLGARYYLSEKFGIFGEFGTGLSVFKVGASFYL